MDTLHIGYRDVDRTPLLYVLKEMASKFEDLDVILDHISDGEEYEQGFLRGDIEVICEHLRFLPPAKLEGYPVRCLASCQNLGTEKLLATETVKSLEDLSGKRVAIRATPSSQLSAKQWLKYLGIGDSLSTIAVEDEEVGRWRQWQKVIDGDASAVVCSQLYMEDALQAGLHVLDVPPLPEIGSLFLAALGPFVTENDRAFRSLIRALYRALYVFHEMPESAIAIIAQEPAKLMHLNDADAVRKCYETLEGGYDRLPVPTVDALSTTFRLIDEGYEPLDGLNFLTLWDLRYLLELEESKFMDSLRTTAWYD